MRDWTKIDILGQWKPTHLTGDTSVFGTCGDLVYIRLKTHSRTHSLKNNGYCCKLQVTTVRGVWTTITTSSDDQYLCRSHRFADVFPWLEESFKDRIIALHTKSFFVLSSKSLPHSPDLNECVCVFCACMGVFYKTNHLNRPPYWMILKKPLRRTFDPSKTDVMQNVIASSQSRECLLICA